MQRLFKVTVNGTDYEVAVEELGTAASPAANFTASVPVLPTNYAAAASASPAKAQQSPGSGDQCAQMGGVVAAIYIKIGQHINEGDRIMDLEAMKMKVPVMATRTGQATRILVAVGDAVQGGQALATIA